MVVEAVIITVSIVALAFALLFGMNLFAGNAKWRKMAGAAPAPAEGRSIGQEKVKSKGRFLSMHKYYEAALGADPSGKNEPDTGMQDELCQLVSHNMRQLDEMYTQVEQEQRNAFSSALLVSFLGFGLLAAGIVLAYAQSSEDLTVYTTVGGAIVEVISGLFFWIYTNCTKQSDELYANLIETQKILMSVQLIGKVGEEKRDDAYLGLVDHIMASDAASTAVPPSAAANGTTTS